MQVKNKVWIDIIDYNDGDEQKAFEADVIFDINSIDAFEKDEDVKIHMSPTNKEDDTDVCFNISLKTFELFFEIIN